MLSYLLILYIFSCLFSFLKCPSNWSRASSVNGRGEKDRVEFLICYLVTYRLSFMELTFPLSQVLEIHASLIKLSVEILFVQTNAEKQQLNIMVFLMSNLLKVLLASHIIYLGKGYQCPWETNRSRLDSLDEGCYYTHINWYPWGDDCWDTYNIPHRTMQGKKLSEGKHLFYLTPLSIMMVHYLSVIKLSTFPCSLLRMPFGIYSLIKLNNNLIFRVDSFVSLNNRRYTGMVQNQD